MKKWLIGLGAVIGTAFAASQLFAVIPGKPITGSKHDFITTSYVGEGGAVLSARNKCGTCHAAHKAKKNDALWTRSDPINPGWVVWNGDVGRALDDTTDGGYLTATQFVGTGSGMCMSCHDGVTAIGKTADYTTSVYMRSAYRGKWGRNLADIHPVGKVVPFGTDGWHADIDAGNTAAGSNVLLETGGTVGCTSCHSMHSSENSSKILRHGERCMACHDR